MKKSSRPPTNRLPSNSIFYNHVVPWLLGGMAVATMIFILIAVGLLLGWVPFR